MAANTSPACSRLIHSIIPASTRCFALCPPLNLDPRCLSASRTYYHRGIAVVRYSYSMLIRRAMTDLSGLRVTSKRVGTRENEGEKEDERERERERKKRGAREIVFFNHV